MVTQTLLQSLGQGDEEMRRQAISQLQLPLAPTLIPALINCLLDPSPAVCEAAVDILGHCSDLPGVSLIVHRLYSENPVERNYVLEIIAKIGNPAIVYIMMVLNDKDRNIRKQAVDALALVASKETILPLCQALQDPDAIVASSAAEALGQLGDEQAVSSLSEALKTDNEWIKTAVLTGLANIGGVNALRILCNQPADQPEFIVATLIRAVGIAADADNDLAVRFLVTLLKQRQPRFEEMILPVLEPLLEKNNSLAQDQQQVVIHLAQKVLNSPNPVLCANAIKSLSLLAHFQPGELSAFAINPHSLVRSAALQAMLLSKDIDAQLAVSIAVDSCEEDALRIQALRLLAKTADWTPLMKTQLFAVAHQDNLRVKIAAINTLLHWKSEQGVTAFLALFHDQDDWDEGVFISEFKVASPEVLGKLIAAGFKKLDNPGRYCMFHALFPLGRKNEIVLNTRAEYKILLKALQDPYWAIRVHAVRLYGKISNENENIFVFMATQDPDERVRATAVNILHDGNQLSEESYLLILHDKSVRVHQAILLIILEMDANQISEKIQIEVLKMASSMSDTEPNQFSELYREIIKKFLPVAGVKGASPNERN